MDEHFAALSEEAASAVRAAAMESAGARYEIARTEPSAVPAACEKLRGIHAKAAEIRQKIFNTTSQS